MRLFKNTSKKSNKTYYQTSFYNKDMGGNVMTKNIFVRFQKGTEPATSEFYDLTLKGYINGEEYDVLLDCYPDGDKFEGRLFFGQFGKKEPTVVKPSGEEVTVKEYETEKSQQLNLNPDDLPFY